MVRVLTPLGSRTLFNHPYLVLFAVAFGLRIGVAATVALFMGGSVFLDDQTYVTMAAERARGATGNWDAYTHFLYERTGALLVPLTAIYRLTGEWTFAGQAFVAIFGAGTAVVAARLAFASAGRDAALVTGLSVAVLPSQVLFSSIVLKDAMVWFFLALLGLLVLLASRYTATRLILVGIGIAAVLVVLGYLRLHTQIVAGWSVVLAATVLRGRARKHALLGAALLIAIATPWVTGAGPGGIRFATNYAEQAPEIRAAGATGAAAIEQARLPSGNSQAPPSEGEASPSKGAAPPSQGAASAVHDGGGPANLAYLPYGLSALLIEPVPWRPPGSFSLSLARMETILWYPLLLCGLVGLSRVWHSREAMLYPLIVGGGTLVMWSLVEGNIGTAYRHRGEFVWVVCLFAAVGIARLRRVLRDRRDLKPSSGPAATVVPK